MLPSESGASVRCLTLGTQALSLKMTSLDALTERPVLASGAYLGTQTWSKRDLSKTKFVPLNLRTISKLPSASFTKCAPHLNLKPCLSQATRSKPLLIVRSKENKVLNYSKCPSSPYGT